MVVGRGVVGMVVVGRVGYRKKMLTNVVYILCILSEEYVLVNH